MTASRQHNKPLVAITMGDPCGIGPEIIVKALTSPDLWEACIPIVIGDPLAMQRAVDLLDAPLQVRTARGVNEIEGRPDTVQLITPTGLLSADDIPYGKPSPKACRATVESIRLAVQLAMSCDVHAVCTCPVHKAYLQRFGFPFPGHTEFLQHITQAAYVVMMLAGPRLRVSLATIHHPIAHVPGLLNREALGRVVRITAEALMRDFGIPAPRIALAGLNPHAGEDGRFGREDLELIVPVVESLQQEPYRISGPFPPDTLFYRAYAGEFDAVVAMYHDQGLIPIKLVHFHEAVNVTLGLPIIRTSVDHGTAYNIAGTGRANPGSLLAAVRMAVVMAHNRRGKVIESPDSFLSPET